MIAWCGCFFFSDVCGVPAFFFFLSFSARRAESVNCDAHYILSGFALVLFFFFFFWSWKEASPHSVGFAVCLLPAPFLNGSHVAFSTFHFFFDFFVFFFFFLLSLSPILK